MTHPLPMVLLEKWTLILSYRWKQGRGWLINECSEPSKFGFDSREQCVSEQPLWTPRYFRGAQHATGGTWLAGLQEGNRVGGRVEKPHPIPSPRGAINHCPHLGLELTPMSSRGAPLPPCQFSLCPGLLLLRVPVGLCPASQLLLAPGLLYMFCMCMLQPELTVSHFHSCLQPCAPSCAGLFPPRTCAILEAPATADLLDGCSMELGCSGSHTCLVPTNK